MLRLLERYRLVERYPRCLMTTGKAQYLGLRGTEYRLRWMGGVMVEQMRGGATYGVE